MFENGSLWLQNIQGTDAGNYTCRAENQHGADQITISLGVQGEGILSTANQ